MNEKSEADSREFNEAMDGESNLPLLARVMELTMIRSIPYEGLCCPWITLPALKKVCSWPNRAVIYALIVLLYLFFLFQSLAIAYNPMDFWNKIEVPSTKDFEKVVFCNNRFIAIGGGGTIISSINGLKWNLESSPTTKDLSSITYGKGLYILTDWAGNIYSSADLKNWAIPHPGTRWLANTAFGNNAFVSVGETIYYSSDGTNWTDLTPSISYNFSGLGFLNNQFIAVGDGIYTSTDGLIWQKVLAESNGVHLRAVAFGNNTYVATGFGVVFSSPDATQWTEQGIGQAGVDHFDRVAFSSGNLVGGNFVVVGSSGTIATSSNGTAWTVRPSGISNGLSGITYANGIFIATGSEGALLRSNQVGVSVAPATLDLYANTGGFSKGSLTLTNYNSVSSINIVSSELAGTNSNEFSISHDECAGKALLKNQSCKIDILYSPINEGKAAAYLLFSTDIDSGEIPLAGVCGPLEKWTPLQTLPPTVNRLKKVNEVYFALGSDGALFSSSDGTAWASLATGLTKDLTDIAFGNGLYMIVTQDGSIFSSANLSTWTESRAGVPDSWLSSIFFAEGLFVAAGSEVVTSTNGDTWTFVSMPQTGRIFPGSWLPLSPNVYSVRFNVNPTGDRINTTGSTLIGPYSTEQRSLMVHWNAVAGTISGVHLVVNLPINNNFFSLNHSISEEKAILYINGSFSTPEICEGTMSLWYDGKFQFRNIPWSAVPIEQNQKLYIRRLEYLQDRFLAVEKSILWSSNGMDWHAQVMAKDVPDTLNDIDYGNGRYVAVGDNGTIMTSGDAMSWSVTPSGTTKNLTGISFGSGNFVAVGSAGTIISSIDGLVWQSHDSATTNDLNDIVEKGLTFLILDKYGIVYQSNPRLNIEPQVTLPTVVGWNLLSSSIPLQAESTFGDGSKFISVWKWKNNNWAVYLPGESTPGAFALSKGFDQLNAVNPGEGFWVNSTKAVLVALTGTPEYDWLSFTSGWNLVGLKSAQATSISELVSSNPTIISVWKWKNNNWSVSLPKEETPGTYASSKGFGKLNVIDPGEGFWVNVGE